MQGSALSLDGKVAIVTGGAGGIGSATVRLMTERGARVVIADLDRDRAATLADRLGPTTLAVALDLADPGSITAMVNGTVAHFGRLDILDNNAAFLDPDMAKRDRDVEDMDLAVWDKTFAVNLRGTMLATKAALPHLRASGAGAIVNTVSNLALQGHVIQAAYAASKAGLIQLTRSIAASHGRRGVRCNAVAPGMTMTPALAQAFPAHIRALVEAETLQPRLGEPQDIAEAVCFLASDAARNITGQCLVSDGGLASHVPGIAGFMALAGE
jgi:NAD(P)-dependent dehydrogenase (short-subunit alcohol dehydrogenase family)